MITKTADCEKVARTPTSGQLVSLFRVKSAQVVTVLTGVYKGQLHVVDERATVDCAYYIGRLHPNFKEDCTQLLPTGCILRQHSAQAHTAGITQDWFWANCP